MAFQSEGFDALLSSWMQWHEDRARAAQLCERSKQPLQGARLVHIRWAMQRAESVRPGAQPELTQERFQLGALVALSFVDLAQHVARARGRFATDARLAVVARVAIVGFGLAGLTFGGRAGLALGLLAGAAAGTGVALAAMRDSFWPSPALALTPVRPGHVIAVALPVGIGIALSIVTFRIDLFLLDAWMGASVVGIYAAAYRVFENETRAA